MCGERAWIAAAVALSIGSSPRVWGARASRVERAGVYRFIPTCVGSAICKRIQTANATVHPHVCGERLENLHVVRHIFWFIPTCVGSAVHSPNIVT